VVDAVAFDACLATDLSIDYSICIQAKDNLHNVTTLGFYKSTEVAINDDGLLMVKDRLADLDPLHLK
jgi:hypothetical protein